jgi:hypothetical protein
LYIQGGTGESHLRLPDIFRLEADNGRRYPLSLADKKFKKK